MWPGACALTLWPHPHINRKDGEGTQHGGGGGGVGGGAQIQTRQAIFLVGS